MILKPVEPAQDPSRGSSWRSGRDPQVTGEPQDVVVAVADTRTT